MLCSMQTSGCWDGEEGQFGVVLLFILSRSITRPLRLGEEVARPNRQSRGGGGGGDAGRMQYVVAVGSSPKWKSHRCSKVSRRLRSRLSCIRTGDEVCGTMRSVLAPNPPFIWAILVRLGVSPHQCSLVVCPFPISPPRALFESPYQGISGVCAWYDAAAAHGRSAFFSKKEITKMKAFIVGVCRLVSCRFIEPKQCLSMCVTMMTKTSVCVCEGTSSLSLLVVWSRIKNSGASISRKMWSC